MPFNPSYKKNFKPDYDRKGYSPNDALAFATASLLAYSSKSEVRSIARQSWGFADVATFDERRGRDVDTQGFLAADEDNLLIAFRGSEPKPSDWLANIQTVTDPGPFKGSKVHEGFQDALFPAILDIANKMGAHLTRRKPKHVWITGHSLGGALACLFASFLLEQRLPIEGLYTFGAPRVGNKEFANALNELAKSERVRSYRVVNTGDAVPHVPPEPWFSHAGTRVVLKGKSVYVGSGKTSTKSKSLWKTMRQEMNDFFMKVGAIPKVVDCHVLDGSEGYIEHLARHAD